jgi:hypothetical protein
MKYPKINWTTTRFRTAASSVNALAVDPANPSTLYAGSANGGTSWNLVYSTSNVYSLAMKPNASQAAAFNLVEAEVQALVKLDILSFDPGSGAHRADPGGHAIYSLPVTGW